MLDDQICMPKRILTQLLSAIAFAGLSVVAAAQSGPVQVGTPVTGPKGVVVSVRDIMHLEANRPLQPRISKDDEMEGPDRTNLKQFPGSPFQSQWPLPNLSSSKPAPGPLAPGTSYFQPVTSFLGSTSAESRWTPPDTMGDVSPTQVLITVNGRIKVLDRAGNVGALNADLDNFFDSVRNGSSAGDPRCRWDRLTNRWIVISFNLASADNRLLIAVSNSATITDTSSFTFYQYTHSAGGATSDQGKFFDYPTLGVDSQALYVGANLFSGGFFNTSLHVIRKSSIMNGGPIVYTPFRTLIDVNNNFAGMYTPQGVDNDDVNSTNGYVIGVDAGFYGLLDARTITNPGTTPVLSPNIPITVNATSGPTNVPASGSANPLSAVDERLMVAKVQRNILTGQTSLWTSHHITVDNTGVALSSGAGGGRNGIRWYELTGFDTGNYAVRQSGTVFDNSAANPYFVWMPTIASTRQGHTVVASSRSSAAIFAGMGSAYRLSGDALGTMNSHILQAGGVGSFNYQNSTQRWGDYSHTVTDPYDGMSVWTFQEYASNTNQYGIRVLKLQAPPPATISSVSPSTGAPGTSVDLTVNGDTSAGTGFFDPGAGFTGRLTASFSGTGVTVSKVTFVSASKITVTAEIGASASGAYDLTVTNPDGQTKSFASALTVNAIGVKSVTLASTIASGSSATGTVTLSGKAPTGGTAVTLSSSNTVLTVPASVTVAAGADSATFTATAGSVTSDTGVTVTATTNGASASAMTQVVNLKLTGLTVTPIAVAGGSATGAKATLTLNAPAGAGGTTVALVSNKPTLATVPASVIVPSGSTTVDFKISTPASVTTASNAKITATLGTSTTSVNLRITSPNVSSLVLSPTSLTGGSSALATGTVTLDAPAPTGGSVVAISTASAALTELSTASLTIPAGSISGTFTVRAKTPVASSTRVNITATLTVSKTTQLIINPPRLVNFRLNKTSVVGGSATTVTGVVSLSGNAAAGGVTITLSSSDTAAATVPVSVVIPEGGTVGTFKVTTFKVTANKTVTISARNLAITKTVNLTVTP
jgi:hypothetical protein